MTDSASIRITGFRHWAGGRFTGFRAQVEGAALTEDSDLRMSGHLVVDIVPGERADILAVAEDGEARSETWCRIELACALANFLHAEVDGGIAPA